MTSRDHRGSRDVVACQFLRLGVGDSEQADHVERGRKDEGDMF
jgi:hypothetical protein